MTTDICIHGAFRSGTNFARGVLETNYACQTHFDVFGWKHDLYPVITKSSDLRYPTISSLLVTKNPFSLIFSLFNYAATTDHNITSAATQGMESFLRNPFIIHDGKRDDVPELYFSTPIEYYAGYHWNLLSAMRRKSNGFHIRYEDLMTVPEEAVRPMVESLELARISETFEIPVNRMKKMGNKQHDVSQFTDTVRFDTSKILPTSYMEPFAQSDRDYVRDHLPRTLVENLGYTEEVYGS